MSKASASRRMVAAAGLVCVASVGAVDDATAALAPYVADANTLALYHFDETAGVADPGNPIVNYGTAGAALELANTGGPDGRNNTTSGGYGATAYAGFGTAFDVLASGTGNYVASSSATGGGVRSEGAITQASLQGASGAFTYEALIRISDLNDEQTIISHDGNMLGNSAGTGERGFMLRILGGQLSFYRVGGSEVANIPGTGDHAFVANEWFHVAVAYTGDEGVSDNLTFYWTRLDSGATQANVVGTATLANDLGSSADGNWLGIGTGTRGQFRSQVKGLVDEVRISSVARGPGDFLFAVPEPASVALMGVAGLVTLGRRRG